MTRIHRLATGAVTLTMVAAIAASSPVLAQSVDAGRGEVPVTVPEGYEAGTPTPLIVLLHGYGGNGEQHDGYFGIGALADEYGFLSIAPDGNVETQGERRSFWNGSDACCDLYDSGVDDVAYIIGLIDAVSAQWSVDPSRVFLVGHSNGGFMSHRVAHERPDRIAAIVSLAGAAGSNDAPPPSAPVNVLQIHGTADEVIEYGGGEIMENRYPGARATAARWARWNGCAQDAGGRESRDLDRSLPGQETGALNWVAGCAPGGSVTLWTISAGAHSPALSDTFAEQVVEWLYMHAKPRAPGE